MAEEQDESSTTIEQSAVEVRSDHDEQHERRHCLNCSAVLTGPYCAECGQKDIPRRQTLAELAINFLSSFWGYESKFIITAKYLLIRPGYLANEFNRGRRERYFHPARLYVFISVVYFFLLTSVPGDEQNQTVNLKADTTTVDYFKTQKGRILTREQYDSVQATLPTGDRDNWFMRRWNYKKLELERRFFENPLGFARSFIDEFTAHFSKVFFVLLPVFAFILLLLYRNHDLFYSEHLAFSICYYNFFFVAGSISLLLDSVSWLSWLSLLVDFSIFIYLYMALRRTYREGRAKTFAKFSAFVLLFGICIVFGLFINLLVTLLMI